MASSCTRRLRESECCWLQSLAPRSVVKLYNQGFTTLSEITLDRFHQFTSLSLQPTLQPYVCASTTPPCRQSTLSSNSILVPYITSIRQREFEISLHQDDQGKEIKGQKGGVFAHDRYLSRNIELVLTFE